MAYSAALNPGAVSDYIEVKPMPSDYATQPRQKKWSKYLSEDKEGIALFNCLKEIPDWDSPEKISNHLSNIYSLASQHAHCTSSSIAANPREPIRISGSLLPQTLRAMKCFGKKYNLDFIGDE